MSREVVFDIETYGDIRQFDLLKVTVVSVYQYEYDRCRSFDENELHLLWPILEKAERLIGYNSLHFDLPILNKYYAGDLLTFPHLDILKVIKDTTGSRYKLNDIAKATVQMEKSADGLQALRWYEEGKIDLIKQYCEQDVMVTKAIYDYGLKNNMLYYPTITGDIVPFPVNFALSEVLNQVTTKGSTGRNLTLPF